MRRLVEDCFFFFSKQKSAYEMRSSDWSSDVCSSYLRGHEVRPAANLKTHHSIQAMLIAPRVFFGSVTVAPRGRAHRRPLPRKICSARTEIGRASCRERVCQYV